MDDMAVLTVVSFLRQNRDKLLLNSISEQIYIRALFGELLTDKASRFLCLNSVMSYQYQVHTRQDI